MSRKHEGISCDSCSKSGFSLRRYKCLICYDFDLCGSCFDLKKEPNNHKNDHPMQCLLTKYDYGTFYAGEFCTELAFSYTCPLCGQLGFSVSSLNKHISSEHSDSNKEVICPVCASLSEGNANQQTKNLGYHISSKHACYLTGDELEISPKSSRKSLKHSNRNTAESSLTKSNSNKAKKTILPNTAASENLSNQNSTLSNSTIFSNHDQGSFGTSDEPLLHTLLNHLYTWRTRRDHLSFGKNQSLTENSRSIQDNTDNNMVGLNDDASNDPSSSNRDSANPTGVVPSRGTLKSLLQERNKNLRRKHGSRHIIDLTGENWRLVDPENDLFSFDDEDLENISMSLNQASMEPNDTIDPEYLDDEDEGIASLFPWSHDIGSESLFNQLKSIINHKNSTSGNVMTSSSNNSFVRSTNSNIYSTLANTRTGAQTNNNVTPSAGGGVSSRSSHSCHQPPLIMDNSAQFHLPVDHDAPRSGYQLPLCTQPHNTSNNPTRPLLINTADYLGSNGLVARDIHKSNSTDNPSKSIPGAAERSQFIRDILLSTFLEQNSTSNATDSFSLNDDDGEDDDDNNKGSNNNK